MTIADLEALLGAYPSQAEIWFEVHGAVDIRGMVTVDPLAALPDGTVTSVVCRVHGSRLFQEEAS